MCDESRSTGACTPLNIVPHSPPFYRPDYLLAWMLAADRNMHSFSDCTTLPHVWQRALLEEERRRIHLVQQQAIEQQQASTRQVRRRGSLGGASISYIKASSHSKICNCSQCPQRPQCAPLVGCAENICHLRLLYPPP